MVKNNKKCINVTNSKYKEKNVYAKTLFSLKNYLREILQTTAVGKS